MVKIDEDWPLTLLPLAVLAMASAPKHLVTWCLRLVVDDLSLESWKWHIPPVNVLQWGDSASKEVTGVALECLDNNFRFEKGVDR